MKNGPILLIDDDADECQLVQEALLQQKIHNPVLCFSDGVEALEYLRTSNTSVFLILSDINMPRMGGLQLRQETNKDPELKQKSIPFIFLTTSATKQAVKQAYEMSVQGFFEKGDSMQQISTLLGEICSYWQRCRHPNN